MMRTLSYFLSVVVFFVLVGCSDGNEAILTKATAVPPTNTALPTPIPTIAVTNTAVPTPIPPTTQPTIEATHEPTNQPTPQPTNSPTPTPEPTLNGIPYSQIIILPDKTIQHMKEVYAQGQEMGRDPHSFSKLGDSIIANADFLTRFDLPGTYILGPYDYLQPVIDNFPGSWERFGVAIRIGLRAWGVFDPAWANKDWCEPNEVLIDCEIRLNNPAILIIHLGSNDLDANFDQFLRKTVERTLELGVIPILLTKADRYEGDDNRNNNTIRQVAVDYAVPLIDFDVVAATLPNRGIKEGDNVHLSGPLSHDYNLPEVYEKGHTVHNLTVLLMMDRIWKEVMSDG
ncbi:MAG: hypothetical protein H6667_20115 [Ardenticatenaceae bacterium]|nr:hypothetical protein [Ardenticatenaceae bacterium]MCB9445989.1 hypothetical protein [Ardenticatenaceae bacterium]